MSDTQLIACPQCDALNRVPSQRHAEKGRCGKCKASLFTGKPLALTRARFEAHALKAQLPLLVDFWAPWCGPCRMMAPVFEAAAQEFEPRVRFAKVNSDEEPEISARYAVRSIPTLVLFKGGREAARVSGALPAGELRRWIESHVES